MNSEFEMSDEQMIEANPERYRRMSAPYESEELAKAAMKAFLKDLRELREKHRIAEVSVIAGVWTPNPEAPDTRRLLWRSMAAYGDSILAYELLRSAATTQAIHLAEMLTEKQKAGTLSKDDIEYEAGRAE